MIKLTKSFSEIVHAGEKGPKTIDCWKANSKRLKNDFYGFIYKKNLWFYSLALLFSLIVIIICLCDKVSYSWNNLFISLACSVVSGVFVSFFLERNANKKWYIAQITKYNYDLEEVYFSIRRITGYELPSEVIVFNYAMNDFAKNKGISSYDDTSISQLIAEVNAMYKDKVDEIPHATVFASTYVIRFIQMIERIVTNTNAFQISYHDYLSGQQKKTLSNIIDEASDYLSVLQNYTQKTYVIRVKTFDDIIKWAQKTASDGFVLENYMQE